MNSLLGGVAVDVRRVSPGVKEQVCRIRVGVGGFCDELSCFVCAVICLPVAAPTLLLVTTTGPVPSRILQFASPQNPTMCIIDLQIPFTCTEGNIETAVFP